MKSTLAETLNEGTPYIVQFAGQGTPWQQMLEQAMTMPGTAQLLRDVVQAGEEILAPVLNQLTAITAGTAAILDSPSRQPNSPWASAPGILLAQYAAWEEFSKLVCTQPEAVVGHSQGILAAAIVQKKGSPAQIYALARLLGAAATYHTRLQGAAPLHGAGPMVSVRGTNEEQLRDIMRDYPSVTVAIRHSWQSYTLSGIPSDLQKVVQECEKHDAVVDWLSVNAPFHSPLLGAAQEQVIAWADACGITCAGRDELVRSILVQPNNWEADMGTALDTQAQWLIDLGPGQTLAAMTKAAVRGRGVGLVQAGSFEAIDKLSVPGVRWHRGDDWSAYTPRVVKIGNELKLETAFTRLTGRAPVLLAGMTPTTVDPDIVASAANAGYWAELAGGGQVTQEVFAENLAGLKKQLKPGYTAQFNAMYLDRYLWNLQFGATNMVGNAREAGAPLDGVVVSAGIPEQEEAVTLVRQLREQGFPYVAFKPGTIAQIRRCLAIARELGDTPLILMVEDGHAGGHHSWEDLESLLLGTYEQIRGQQNVVLCVGGGLGDPRRAAEFLTGRWALRYSSVPMPVDGVMVGTAAMAAKEAHTNADVKELLVNTPGIALSDRGGWVRSGEVRGGVTSGLSSLLADLYEVDNAASRAARIIAEVNGDPQAREARREEIISAINATAKPYFGDLEKMTYAQVLRRYVQLCYPWNDVSWQERFQELLQRCEARLCAEEYGDIATEFGHLESAQPQAVAQIVARYPQAESIALTAADCAWFIELCRKYSKPVPFVPAIDDSILRWWGADSLWQSHDPRYSADQVRIIPGPVSVAAIKKANEPIAEILGRYELAAIAELTGQDAAYAGDAAGVGAPDQGETVQGVTAEDQAASASSENGSAAPPSAAAAYACRVSRLAATAQDYVRSAPHILWHGYLIANPAQQLDAYELRASDKGIDIVISLDTLWDGTSAKQHAVRELLIPLLIDESCAQGAAPRVDDERLPSVMRAMLAATAGVGGANILGDDIAQLPEIDPASVDSGHPFGWARYSFTYAVELGALHAGVTAQTLPSELQLAPIVPAALIGMCWPSIYAALGSAYANDYPVIEGLLNAVHLDHTEDLDTDNLREGRIDVRSACVGVEESASGRVVTVRSELSQEGADLGVFTERFAIRGRVNDSRLPDDPPIAGGVYAPAGAADIVERPRTLLRKVQVQAPENMTAFAMVSGDYNPIHTSYRAAKVAGLQAPLVHGMWLCAAAQHAVAAAGSDHVDAGWHIVGWTYRMYGMVELGDTVEISVERTGVFRAGGTLLEVTCRVNKNIVSQASVAVRAQRTAYVYPGQGIQAQGMTLDEQEKSPAVREVWRKADAHTRESLGFSILAVVRDNPQEITARGTVYRHPAGVLNLTQFTQVALATVAFAQTERLREEGVLADRAFFAGHSLGEYNALSAYAGMFPLETVLDIVFHRGSTMHHLVERDDRGRSNYQMGALRPNQCGISDAQVRDYVQTIAEESREFLEIVNYNLAGEQYAVAGTIAGVKALEADALRRAQERGGKRPFMLIPGIDVPFHSSVLRSGVPDFRDRLTVLLPAYLNPDVLIGRYIPNLVARPFELSADFARSIIAVVGASPELEELQARLSAYENDPSGHADERAELVRQTLIELLAWQFASPVRWIETQDVLIAQEGVESFVEIGLGASPTLANLAAKTLLQPRYSGASVQISNVQRDAAAVYLTDTPIAFIDQRIGNNTSLEHAGNDSGNTGSVPADSEMALGAAAGGDAGGSVAGAVSGDASQGGSAGNGSGDGVGSCGASGQAVSGGGAGVDSAAAAARTAASGAAGAVQSVQAAGAAAGRASGSAEELSFTASDAVKILLVFANKITLEQITESDTIETLTGGVSSKRNQVLMDMAAELSVSSIDGAAEAAISELSKQVDALAHNYTPFGGVLNEAISERLHKLFGAAGVKPARIEKRLNQYWGLGSSWAAWVKALLLLDTRDGKSLRGGLLAQLPSAAPGSSAGADELIDAAVLRVAALHGVAAAPLAATQGAAGDVVDSAALNEFAEHIEGALANNARALLAQLGQSVSAAVSIGAEEAARGQATSDREVLDAVEQELGGQWVRAVTPVFSAQKAVLLNDRWASAREDLARFAAGETLPESVSFAGAGAELARQARYYAAHSNLAVHQQEFLERCARAAESSEPGPYSGMVAVVTGMTPDSIGGAVVAQLLAGGATVVATASHVSQERLLFARSLYRCHARCDAAMWLVPANLTSYRDIDALIEWIGSPEVQTVGASTKVIKPALVPDVLFPFAAPRVFGMMDEAGSATETQARLMLWGLERAIGGLAKIGSYTNVDHRLHVVLPGSPNHGTFGGDGAYGEVKAALEAIVNKWSREPWGKRTSLVHAKIGWVRGTGLMAGNDPLVDSVHKAGVRTYSTAEMAQELIGLISSEVRAGAAQAPVEADLTGGLKQLDFASLQLDSAAACPNEPEQNRSAATIAALPSPAAAQLPAYSASDWENGTVRPEQMVVIVGHGEISTWGSRRTRKAAEYGVAADGSVALTPAAVLELAWGMGLITWHDSPVAGWYGQDDKLVPEVEIYARFREEVVQRCGIRKLTNSLTITDCTAADAASVFLDRDVSFTVTSYDEARAYVDADPDFTKAELNEGEWVVTRLKGASVLMPRRTKLSRFVAGQFPTDLDPARWGIPASLIEGIDNTAVWNLLTTVDAFVSSGFTPEDVLQAVHPTMMGNTQGTGFGGMESIRALFLERFFSSDVPHDVLQETLANVVAAHTMQSYVGGYGSMIQPVGACATAAVSIEVATDKILAGKDLFVVAGGIDDISVESLEGFGMMNATADSQTLKDKGISERFFSRAGDDRRGGFVEAQGGGAVLLARGDVALQLGLPVYGVVAYAQSFADGAHTSIPAPGLGALGAGVGGNESALVRSLAALGVSVDDISVVSKHDTSTNANDPNEAELHVRLARAWGRSAGNPLHVISQKTLTGHAKGGAALLQLGGIMDVFASDTIPANRALDNLDPVFAADDYLVWLREPLQLAKPVKAALATSLGFGHVSSLMAFVHPGAFEAAVERAHGAERAAQWRAAANQRLQAGARQLEQAMVGKAALYEPIDNRRIAPEKAALDIHEAEAAMLLNADARLGEGGFYAQEDALWA